MLTTRPTRSANHRVERPEPNSTSKSVGRSHCPRNSIAPVTSHGASGLRLCQKARARRSRTYRGVQCALGCRRSVIDRDCMSFVLVALRLSAQCAGTPRSDSKAERSSSEARRAVQIAADDDPQDLRRTPAPEEEAGVPEV